MKKLCDVGPVAFKKINDKKAMPIKANSDNPIANCEANFEREKKPLIIPKGIIMPKTSGTIPDREYPLDVNPHIIPDALITTPITIKPMARVFKLSHRQLY